jgi:hypothetical protein
MGVVGHIFSAHRRVLSNFMSIDVFLPSPAIHFLRACRSSLIARATPSPAAVAPGPAALRLAADAEPHADFGVGNQLATPMTLYLSARRLGKHTSWKKHELVDR